MSDKSPTHSSDFAERLVSVEPLPADRKSELQQELHVMFEKKLTLTQRITFAIVSVFALASSALCGYLAVTVHELPASGRVGLSIGTLFGLAFAIAGFRILKRGAIDLRRDLWKIPNLVWGFIVLMVPCFLIGAMSMEDRLLGIMLIGQSLAFLIGAGVYLLARRIEYSEIATRERLLQIELLIADLIERQNHS